MPQSYFHNFRALGIFVTISLYKKGLKMKIHELITFVKNHAVISRVIIESCFEGNDPRFDGTVIELLETQYLFLEVPVVNATFDSVNGVLNIFYDPDNL